MFKTLKPLTYQIHGHLRLRETGDYSFASDDMFVPIVLSEMADAAREYPLVFIKDQALPVVLMGVEKGVNAYVAADGAWCARYVPGHIQAYPFLLGENAKKPDEFVVALDMDAPQISTDQEGDPLFNDKQQPSEAVQRRIDLLTTMKKAEPRMKQMVADLRASGLLRDRAIRVERGGEEPTQVTGIEVVDEAKLNALGEAEFLQLRAKGLLPLIYAHLLSVGNLRQGPIAGKYPDLAAHAAPRAQPTPKKKTGSDFDLSLFAVDDGDFEITH